jgi:trehalose/maltose hydrolase-like predicted phosphorylase
VNPEPAVPQLQLDVDLGDEPASGWRLDFDLGDDPAVDRARVTLLALSDGTTSIVGEPSCATDRAALVLAAGAFGIAADGLVRPLPGAVWTDLRPEEGPVSWTLDLRRGVMTCRRPGSAHRAQRFVSVARAGIGVLRAEGPPGRAWPGPLRAPDVPPELVCAFDYREEKVDGPAGPVLVARTVSDRATVAVAAAQRELDDDADAAAARLERVVAVRAGRDARGRDVVDLLAGATAAGTDVLLDEHVREWADRWANADIEIDGDPGSQLAVRFALFHLLSCAATQGEAAVGARGLSGLAYAGHVFWDTDVYVLPTLAATLPSAARAVIEYRVRRLPAARARAAAEDRPGARFPWESADSGYDVTPLSATDIEGRVIPIVTGSHAIHINSDVAWAAAHLADWTGDQSFLRGDTGDLVVATAEYLASRVRHDPDGVAHIEGVVGPDEYHEVVDDNSYTNQMARWHLRRAAALAGEAADADEPRRLRRIADALTVGLDPATGRHEQFRGYWGLDDVRIAELATVPVAADLLLGRDLVRRSQVLKQPDVLMAHHLLAEDDPPGSLIADLDHYLPRTAHGSSLSPAICASLRARAGRPDDAMALFDVAARLDLDDLTDTTAGGLHLATMGGLWQAVVWGFAGTRPIGDALRIDPQLPTRWRSLTVRVVFRGVPLRILIDHQRVRVEAPREVPVTVCGRATTAPCSVSMREVVR